MLVRKTLSHDVTFLVFLPLRKKMDFPRVLIPKESPAATPINWLSNDFAIQKIIVKSQ